VGRQNYIVGLWPAIFDLPLIDGRRGTDNGYRGQRGRNLPEALIDELGLGCRGGTTPSPLVLALGCGWLSSWARRQDSNLQDLRES
jgi:hypothetical protein